MTSWTEKINYEAVSICPFPFKVKPCTCLKWKGSCSLVSLRCRLPWGCHSLSHCLFLYSLFTPLSQSIFKTEIPHCYSPSSHKSTAGPDPYRPSPHGRTAPGNGLKQLWLQWTCVTCVCRFQCWILDILYIPTDRLWRVVQRFEAWLVVKWNCLLWKPRDIHWTLSSPSSHWLAASFLKKSSGLEHSGYKRSPETQVWELHSNEIQWSILHERSFWDATVAS